MFSKNVQISERPHLPKAMASSAFDDDGVATRDREVVENGVVQGYFLGTYSARKLGMQSTGNAGGAHNLIVHRAARFCRASSSRWGAACWSPNCSVTA